MEIKKVKPGRIKQRGTSVVLTEVPLCFIVNSFFCLYISDFTDQEPDGTSKTV
jgi:hypothetical protein